MYKQNVLLATISSSYEDWVPYAVGCLISHCLKNQYIKDNYKFMDPEFRHNWDTEEFNIKLLQADILGLTCYVWNQSANDTIAQRFKEYNPEGIVIYGGPNVTEDMQRKYVDHFVMGPGEIEFEKILDTNASSEYKIPTPYTDGLFDHILDDAFVAFETNRGCPYGCAFCDWGGVARSKITKVDEQQVYDTIEHILKHKPKRLEILDANFGIFERDVDFVRHIVKHKQRDMLLTFAGFAKNGSKWLPEIMNLTMDNFNDKMRNVKISLQTLTPEVLETIDRKNIKTDNLLSITQNLENVNINSELIIGLPGETPASWKDTLMQHKDLGIRFGRGYPLYVLPNTPMATPEYREKYNIKTKKMILPSGETFEMIYECHSYGLEEIKEIYLIWNKFNTFYNFYGYDKWDIDFLPEMRIHEVEEALERIFKPEDEFHLEGYDYEYLHKNLGRGKELVYLGHNTQSPFAVHAPSSSTDS